MMIWRMESAVSQGREALLAPKEPRSTVHRHRTAPLKLLLFLTLGLAPAVSALPGKSPPAHPVDLNVATVKELEQLPGVGPATAQAIVQFRAKGAGFRRVEDILAVRGISRTRFEKLRPYITVGLPGKIPASGSPHVAADSPSLKQTSARGPAH